MRPALTLLGTRAVQAALTAWLLATLCFAFVHALPGDMALRVAAARVGDERVTVETTERIRREEGLDRPLAVQYAAWLGSIATGDLGQSLVSRQPCGRRSPITAASRSAWARSAGWSPISSPCRSASPAVLRREDGSTA
ncbi:hypothetical protein [Bosea sp. 685]|uniref:hypothetical protein n=1 Tax=Bosea sp. 685 TaxID=3080057 RepID=UPI002892FFF7|nr:hypothetical protein [Bosea sp. 685]WNJ90892.1 hypothetical protein RMR04_31845 [Bosea sp. 685]